MARQRQRQRRAESSLTRTDQSNAVRVGVSLKELDQSPIVAPGRNHGNRVGQLDDAVQARYVRVVQAVPGLHFFLQELDQRVSSSGQSAKQ